MGSIPPSMNIDGIALPYITTLVLNAHGFLHTPIEFITSLLPLHFRCFQEMQLLHLIEARKLHSCRMIGSTN
jgi:hypothetical protein